MNLKNSVPTHQLMTRKSRIYIICYIVWSCICFVCSIFAPMNSEKVVFNSAISNREILQDNDFGLYAVVILLVLHGCVIAFSALSLKQKKAFLDGLVMRTSIVALLLNGILYLQYQGFHTALTIHAVFSLMLLIWSADSYYKEKANKKKTNEWIEQQLKNETFPKTKYYNEKKNNTDKMTASEFEIVSPLENATSKINNSHIFDQLKAKDSSNNIITVEFKDLKDTINICNNKNIEPVENNTNILQDNDYSFKELKSNAYIEYNKNNNKDNDKQIAIYKTDGMTEEAYIEPTFDISTQYIESEN